MVIRDPALALARSLLGVGRATLRRLPQPAPLSAPGVSIGPVTMAGLPPWAPPDQPQSGGFRRPAPRFVEPASARAAAGAAWAASRAGSGFPRPAPPVELETPPAARST